MLFLASTRPHLLNAATPTQDSTPLPLDAHIAIRPLMAARLVSSTKDSLSAPSAAPQIMSCQVLSAASNPLDIFLMETEGVF